MINTLEKNTVRLFLYGCRGHIGMKGNEIADKAAQKCIYFTQDHVSLPLLMEELRKFDHKIILSSEQNLADS